MKILALLTERKSNNNQVLSIAKKLTEKKGGELVKKTVRFSRFIRLPNFILRFVPVWMLVAKNDGFNEIDDCDAIVTCGRQSSRYAIHLKKNIFLKAKIIQILKPEVSTKNIDVVLMPSHDQKKQRCQKTVFFNGAIFDNDTHKDEKSSSRGTVEKLVENKKIDNDFIGVFIGGKSKHFKFTKLDIAKISQKLNDIYRVTKKPFFITTSPRTEESHVKILESHLRCKYYLYNYNKENGMSNPYFGIIEKASTIIATGDSISMISEIISFGKPLYLYTDGIVTKKYKMFHKKITEIGGARFLPSDNNLVEFDPIKLNNIDEIVDTILAKIE